MCLINPGRIHPSKHFVIGYKLLMWRQNAWRSSLASQIWHFAELVKAKHGKDVNFRGNWCYKYKSGIHAYKNSKFVIKKLDGYTERTRRKYRLVKVLLFGVTHQDDKSYRAGHAMIIDTLDSATGKRISW